MLSASRRGTLGEEEAAAAAEDDDGGEVIGDRDVEEESLEKVMEDMAVFFPAVVGLNVAGCGAVSAPFWERSKSGTGAEPEELAEEEWLVVALLPSAEDID